MLTISRDEANSLIKPKLDEFKEKARQYYNKESEVFSNWDHERQIKFVNSIVEKANNSGIIYENDIIVFGNINLEKLHDNKKWIIRDDVNNILENDKLKSGVKILQLFSLK